MSLRAFMIAVVMSFTAALVQGQVVLNDSVRTFTTLTNTTITLNGQSRLHLSGTGNPVSGSIIHLNSPDAWLHFDNLRPSTVQSTILGQIRVNGANAAHGTNVRIVQYGMGTVIIPFTNGIQPLETFTDTGFRGASMRHNLYTYYDSSSDLGVLYENISSFKLKRGFMATLGTRADGTGTSKVYIAQDHDVNVGTLPGNLDNAVRFVRVFPWRWVSKKGACDVSPDTLDAAWHYNWNNNKSSTLNWEYVPIRQQRWWPSLPTNSTSVTHFLGYNEPDNPVEDSYQSLGNGSRDAAIAAWPELLATGLRVGSPAVTDGGKWWLYDFMDKANAAGLRVDYIAIHFYQCGISATQLRAWLEEIWNRYRKPIWVTEFNNGANWTGCTDPTYQQNADAIASWIDMMDNTPWIERYAVYSNVEHTRFMEYSTGGLTPAGVVYKANRSPIGYLQESYPLAVRRGVALLDFDGDTRDSSGHDHRAVHHGAADFTTGNDGQAIDLNGSSDHLELPPGLINSNAMTFAAWVRWDGGAANQRIFDFGNDTEQFFFLSPSSGGQLRLGLRNNSGSTKSIATNALPSGTWQHVAVTVQGSAAKLFVNGSLQAQGSLVDPALSSTTRNYLGKSQWADDPLFDGRLDEVVILDSALPDSEIANLMSGVDSPYVAHWKGDVDAVWTTNNAGNTNWATDSTGGTDTAAPPASNTEVHFSSGSPNTTLGANVAIDSLIVSTTSPVGIGGSHDLTLGSRGIYLGENSGALNLQTSGRIILGADQLWTQQSPNPLTVTSELAGDSRLVITGGGRVVLAGNNSHSGDLVIVGGGTVSVSSISAALGDASQILLGGSGLTGGILYTGTGETTNRSLGFQGGLGTPGIVLEQAGSGLLKLTSNLTSIATVPKTLTLRGSTAGEGEISGIIPNGGTTTSLFKEGSGTWTLSAANTYSGTTTLSAGTLAIGHDSALGSGTLELRGGALRSSSTATRTLANPINLSANMTFSGSGPLVFTGNVSGGSLAKTFTVTNPRTEFTGVINGSGTRTKSGNGVLVLSGSNSYTGSTLVSAGTLEVNGSLHASSQVSVSFGATLRGTGNIGGNVIFASNSRLGWSLHSHTTTTTPLTSGPVTANAGALVTLQFNAPGSTVDFTDPFWSQIRTWPLLSTPSTTGTFSLGTISTDSNGLAIDAIGSFHLDHHASGVSLVYTPDGLEPPPAPENVRSIASRNVVHLSWDPAPGATGYLILRSTSPGGPYETLATVVGDTSYVDRTSADGVTYHYAVASTNPNGSSAPSVESIATPHAASTLLKADNSTALDLAASWTGNIIPTAFDTARWTGLTGANSVLLGSDATWHGISIGTTGGNVGITGSSILTLGSGGIDLSASNRHLEIQTSLSLAPGHQVWNLGAGRTLTLGSGSFTRSPGSTLRVNGGSVSSSLSGLSNDASSGGGLIGPWAFIGSGSATSHAILQGGTLQAFTGAISNAGFGWTSGNPATSNYDITGVHSALGVSRTAHTVRYTGPAGTQTWGNSGGNVTLTLHSLLNSGSGTLTFAKGGTGTGTGIVVGANRELVLHAAQSGILMQLPIFNHSSGASALTLIGTAGITLDAANSHSGTTTIGAGTVNLTGQGTTGSGPVHIAADATLNLNRAMTLGNAVSGRGTLRATNTITLTADLGNFDGTYIHDTTTSSSALSQTSAASRRTSYHLASAQGSQQGLILAVTTGNPVFEIGALSGVTNSLVRNGNSVTGNSTLRVGYLHSHSTFAGNFGGGGGTMALTKVGLGTLTLSGTASHTGITRIEAGTLLLQGSFTGSSPTSVLPGGRLAGTGTSDGNLSIANNGILAPGNQNSGTLTLSGNLSLADGAILEAGLGTTSARLQLSSTPVITGTTRIRLIALPGFGPGTYPLITASGSINPASFSIDEAPEGFLYLLSATSGTLHVTVALPPEAPTGLVATGNDSGVSLTWDSAPGVTSWIVKRAPYESGDFETLATVTSPAFTDATSLPGEIHRYHVIAQVSGFESPPSPTAVSGRPTHIHVWRHLHFGTIDDTGPAADAADPDEDGRNNLLEYALGSDPHSIDSPPGLTEPEDRLTLSFTRNFQALDIVISVMATDDLNAGPWHEIARGSGGAAFTSIIDGQDSGALVTETPNGTQRTVIVSDPIQKSNPAHPTRFLRIVVER